MYESLTYDRRTQIFIRIGAQEVPENLLMDQYMTVSLRSQVIFGQINSGYQFGDRNLPFRIFKKV